VLKAKDTIVAIETPLERVLVSKISAGMIQDNGPHVAENEKLYAQVQMIKPQDAALLFATPGGNCAIKMQATRKQTCS
jgi:translation elongation factor EF-1alpha